MVVWVQSVVPCGVLPFSSFPDGSLGAPSGPVNYPGLLNGYVKRPPWKVAGVDYHVGIDRSLYPTNGSLASAASGTLPSGASRAGNTITLTGTNIVLEGFDFTVGTGWVVNITGSGCVVKNCNFVSTATFPDQQASINGTSSSTITQCEFVGSQTIGSVGGSLVGANGTGDCIFTYNWIRNAYAIGGVFSSNGAVTQNIIWKFNALENAGCGRASSGGAVHGDWVQQYNDTTHIGTGLYQWSLWYQSISSAIADTQGLSLNSANTAQAPNIENHADNNVMISIAGAHVSFGIIMYAPNLNGPGTLNNNYFDLTTMDAMGNENPEFNPTGQPGHGPYNGPVTWTGNIDMKTGGTVVPDT